MTLDDWDKRRLLIHLKEAERRYVWQTSQVAILASRMGLVSPPPADDPNLDDVRNALADVRTMIAKLKE